MFSMTFVKLSYFLLRYSAKEKVCVLLIQIHTNLIEWNYKMSKPSNAYLKSVCITELEVEG